MGNRVDRGRRRAIIGPSHIVDISIIDMARKEVDSCALCHPHPFGPHRPRPAELSAALPQGDGPLPRAAQGAAVSERAGTQQPAGAGRLLRRGPLGHLPDAGQPGAGGLCHPQPLPQRPAQRSGGADPAGPGRQGRDALDAWEGRCKVIEEQMLQGFSPEERAQLRDFLERTYRNVGGRFLEEETP